MGASRSAAAAGYRRPAWPRLKLDVQTRAQAVAVAYESGLIRVLRKNADVMAQFALGVGEN
jgi:hypothetical protein